MSWVLGHFWGAATIFCIYKGNSKKYKGKYAVKPFLLSFVVGRSNRLNSFARLLHFYCCFQKHPYWPPLMSYSHMAIWPYGHISTIWPYGHIDIWRRMASIWVSPETAKQMQQSGEGIMLIRPSCQKWERKWSDGIFSFVFFRISFVYAKNGGRSSEMP